MSRISKFAALLLYVALLIIVAPPTTAADDEAEDREELAGSVWVIPDLFEFLSIFEVKPDGTVVAGRGGHFGIEKEIRWIGTYRNKQLELRNKRYAENASLPRYAEEGAGPSETLVALVDGSKMTG